MDGISSVEEECRSDYLALKPNIADRWPEDATRPKRPNGASRGGAAEPVIDEA